MRKRKCSDPGKERDQQARGERERERERAQEASSSCFRDGSSYAVDTVRTTKEEEEALPVWRIVFL